MNDRPIPPISQVHAPKFRDAQHRRAAAQAFDAEIGPYHRVRPGYPAELHELLGNPASAADIGCGTGKLTEQLQRLAPEALVVGVDPSAAMLSEFRQHTGLPAVRGSAEALPLASNSMDLLTCAQTWHWVDPQQASASCARVLRPGGRLVLAWNTLDVAIPWVHRLTRITHAGDTLAEGFEPQVAAPMAITRTLRMRWEQPLAVADLHTLMHTRSYWLRAKAAIREKMTANLDWYIHYLGLDPKGEVTLPYRLDAFVLEAATR